MYHTLCNPTFYLFYLSKEEVLISTTSRLAYLARKCPSLPDHKTYGIREYDPEISLLTISR